MMKTVERRLPSIDWIALGIGVVGLVMSRVQVQGAFQWMGLLGLAVFGPPLLRELGLLKDDDEYTRNIRWRAGFHAAMFAGVAIFLNWVAMGVYIQHPEAIEHKLWLFPINELRQNIVVVFLFSYLIQYWGAPRGVFRILLGMVAILAIDMGMGLAQGRNFHGFLWPAMGVMAVCTILLVSGAFLATRRPRLTGRLIMGLGALCVAFMVSQVFTLPPQGEMYGWLAMRLGMISSAITMAMVFTILGLSLWRWDARED